MIRRTRGSRRSTWITETRTRSRTSTGFVSSASARRPSKPKLGVEDVAPGAVVSAIVSDWPRQSIRSTCARSRPRSPSPSTRSRPWSIWSILGQATDQPSARRRRSSRSWSAMVMSSPRVELGLAGGRGDRPLVGRRGERARPRRASRRRSSFDCAGVAHARTPSVHFVWPAGAGAAPRPRRRSSRSTAVPLTVSLRLTGGVTVIGKECVHLSTLEVDQDGGHGSLTSRSSRWTPSRSRPTPSSRCPAARVERDLLAGDLDRAVRLHDAPWRPSRARS